MRLADGDETEMSKLLLFLLLLLSACSTPYWREYHIKDLTVIETDKAVELCEGAEACYLVNMGVVVIEPGDWDRLGHEMCHVLYDDMDHEAQCRQ